MISIFPAEEIKRTMLYLGRFDTEVVTDEKIHAAETERQLEEKSEEIIADNL